jgi:phosphatidylserine decarboxylase
MRWHRSAPLLDAYALLPHRLLNRACAALTAAERPRWLVERAIATWVRGAGIDLGDFEDQAYRSIDDFFLRRLRPGARPIGDGIVSPVDGVLFAAGRIEVERPLLIKGQRLALRRLCFGEGAAPGRDATLDAYEGGAFAAIFLTPHGYHRVHAPLDLEIVEACWIPGRFFPQNEDALGRIDRVYERNERVTLRCRASGGAELLVVMVGASLVGGIHLEGLARAAWARRAPAPLGRRVTKGDEIGHFAFGSTVVLMLPRALAAEPLARVGDPLVMGRRLFAAPGRARVTARCRRRRSRRRSSRARWRRPSSDRTRPPCRRSSGCRARPRRPRGRRRSRGRRRRAACRSRWRDRR